MLGNKKENGKAMKCPRAFLVVVVLALLLVGQAITVEASITTLPTPPAAPTLKSPASGSTVPTLTPRLEWNASTGAADYGLQVATAFTFTTLLVNVTGITDLYYDIAPGTLNWNSIYYWRVNARNSYGSTSVWSRLRYFRTAVGPPPNAPSNLVATPISSSQISLTWQDNSIDETGFKIERKTGSGSYSQIATVGAGITSYSNTALSASTTYYYRVRAYNAAGNSDYSNEASKTTLPPPPTAPVLKSPASGSMVSTLTPRLEWNASTGAADYGLQVATTFTFTTLLVNVTGITDVYYEIAPGTLNWNTVYYWRVNARNSYGSTSVWSGIRYFRTAIGPPPNAPSDLVATPISSYQINLSWQDNSTDETSFKVERKTGTGSYAQIATVGAGVTSYSNTPLTASTTYYYRVRAYNAAGNSDYSNEASGTTLPPPPAAPVLKSPASGSMVATLTPRLEWNASTGATDYGLQVATTFTFTTLLVNETGITDVYYEIAPGTLNWNTVYYWRVNARNSFGSTSRWSSYRYFRTPAPRLFILTISSTAGGSVTNPGEGIFIYEAGEVVSLTATPAFGWQIEQWTGTDDDSSTSTINTVTMTSHKSVKVFFKESTPTIVFTYSGTGPLTTPPFQVSSSPWKLHFTTSWAGTFSVQVRDGSTGWVVNQAVSAGGVYDTYVYGHTGSLHFSLENVPGNGQWTLSVIENPPAPTPDPGTVFTYSGTGSVTTPPFQVSSSPWKLHFTTSWAGTFSVQVRDGSTEWVVNQAVSAGGIYDTYVYGHTGSLHFSAESVPGNGQWTLSVTENPPAPTPDPGTVFTYSGTGSVTTPPFQVSSSPWKLHFTTSWAGTFSVQVRDGSTEWVVNQAVSAGGVYDIYVYDHTGFLHFSLENVPGNGQWTLSVIEDS